MNESPLNPFRPTRWEHHRNGRPLIWFTDTADELAGDKSVYVYGGRGVGKTSLLKGICWEDLTLNESLRMQRKLADFKHIGIYIRFPDHISASMSHRSWGSQFPNAANPDLEYYRFFSLAIELTCIERTLEACHSLRLENYLVYQPNQELRIVKVIIDEFPELAFFSAQTPKTFLELSRTARIIVRRMNEACGRGILQDFIDKLPAREPNQLLAFVSEYLQEAVQIISQFEQKQVSFKFCLDDCEALSSVQRKSLNSLVRLSRSPVSWVISSVGTAHENSETFIPAQPLTDADRRIMSLDDRDNADFKQLCQSVVGLRLLFSLPEGMRVDYNQERISEFFDLDQRLGIKDVNDLMGQMCKRSHRPLAVSVRSSAERLAQAIAVADPKTAKKFNEKSGRLPYYESYILLHWRGREEAFNSQFEQENIGEMDQYGFAYSDQAFNAWLRRKQLNGLLHFAASLRVRRMPLSGANIIVSLADGSIRDFLEIMGEIFEKYIENHEMDKSDPNSLMRFATSRTSIAAQTQTDGIYSASSKYLDGITARSEIDSDVISRLINGLGYLTAFLQSNPNDPRVFASAERGVFLVEFPSLDEGLLSKEHAFVEEAIQQGVLAGYLRPVDIPKSLKLNQVDRKSRLSTFRLHRRFAPQFRFSYRGAYEPVRLSPDEIGKLCPKPEEASPFAWAKAMAGIAQKFGDPQILLPFEEPFDGN